MPKKEYKELPLILKQELARKKIEEDRRKKEACQRRAQVNNAVIVQGILRGFAA